MAWLNSAAGYGGLSKVCHWAIAGLFALQYVGAAIMQNLGPNGHLLGVTQDGAYNWHKTLGLVALAIALVRIWARRAGELPPWAPTLSDGEKAFIHRAEQALYAAMIVMPASGFIYVMAGDYGVRLFGLWEMPRPFPPSPILAASAKWIHIGSAWMLALAVAAHVGLVLRHHFVIRDGLLKRMLWPAR
jgi:cytochrome b561